MSKFFINKHHLNFAQQALKYQDFAILYQHVIKCYNLLTIIYTHLMSNNYVLVFGAGSLGRAITYELCAQGYRTIVAANSENDLLQLRQNLTNTRPELNRRLTTYTVDVLNQHSLTQLEKEIRLRHAYTGARLQAVIYAVGACPPGGFTHEVSTPLYEISNEKMEHDFRLYVTGFMNVGRNFLRHIQDHGHVVALSSAVTRLTPETCPPWLHAWHYIATKAALDKIIMGYRHSPLVRQKKLLIHRIAPSAVDTPFHSQAVTPQVLNVLPVHAVVTEIMQALSSQVAIDKDLLPTQSPEPNANCAAPTIPA